MAKLSRNECNKVALKTIDDESVVRITLNHASADTATPKQVSTDPPVMNRKSSPITKEEAICMMAPREITSKSE